MKLKKGDCVILSSWIEETKEGFRVDEEYPIGIVKSLRESTVEVWRAQGKIVANIHWNNEEKAKELVGGETNRFLRDPYDDWSGGPYPSLMRVSKSGNEWEAVECSGNGMLIEESKVVFRWQKL